MNNKGFVVSAVLYPLLVLFLALIMGLISMSSTRKNILDNMKMEISDSIFDSVTCDCEEINSTLKKYGQSIKNIENDITAIENQISTINTTQNTIKTDLTNLTSRVSSLETNVTSLTTRVSTIENNYATKTTTNLLNTKISNLTTTVSGISTSLTSLRNRVNALTKNELNIYMSPSGNDSNDGLSSSNPMKTLESVLNKYSNSYLRIYLADGTYNWGNIRIYGRSIDITSANYNRDSVMVNVNNFCGENASVSLRYLKMHVITDGCMTEWNDDNTKIVYRRIDTFNNEANISWGTMMFVNSSLYFETIILDDINDSDANVGGMVYLYDSSLNAQYSTFKTYGSALIASSNSHAYGYRTTFEAIDGYNDKIDALVSSIGGSRLFLKCSPKLDAGASDYFYAYKDGSSTLKISTLSKVGKTSGSPSVTVATDYDDCLF